MLKEDTPLTYGTILIKFPFLIKISLNFSTGLDGVYFGVRKHDNKIYSWHHPTNPTKKLNVFNFYFFI